MRAALALVLAVATVACHNDERAPYDFERMRLQEKPSPYAGFTQPAPAHTVAREAPAPVTGDVTAIPLAVTPQLLATGRDRFRIYCAVCHGEAGYGGSIVASNMGPPLPPSLHAAHARAYTPGALYMLITGGMGRMPPYGWALTPAQRWAIVAYVRDMQANPAHDAAAIRDSISADSIRALAAGGFTQ